MSEQTCSCCSTGTNRADERADGGSVTTDNAPTNTLDRRVPTAVGDLLATAYGMESRPETLGGVADGLQTWARVQDAWPPSFEDLCHADDTRHVLELDDEIHHFACVIDPLMAQGFLDAEQMVVRSASPVEGAEIEIRIEDGEASVTPSTAVLSFGVAKAVEQLDGEEFAPEAAYTQVCAYANAFPNRTTYEVWAEETEEAATMAMPMEEGIELARALVA